MDQLIDIVDKYPVRSGSVIYITLHYAATCSGVERLSAFNAIEAFSDKHLLAAENFMIADMKAFKEKNG